MKRIERLKFAILWAMTLILSLETKAQNPGDLDASFGTDGIATLDVAGLDDRVNKVILQTDGKIVCVGTTQAGIVVRDHLTVRFLADGMPDDGFGQNGIVVEALSSGDDAAFSVLQQQDGKLLTLGYYYAQSNGDYAMLRYDTNGDLDLSFGDSGLMTLDINGLSNTMTDGVLLSDGGVMTGGNVGSDIGLVKFSADGLVDSSFSDDGISILDLGTSQDYSGALNMLGNGSFLTTGFMGTGSESDAMVSRILPNGELDPTFSGTGVVNLAISQSYDIASASTVLQNEKILVVGSAWDNSSMSEIFIARLLSDGSFDNSFGTLGVVRFDIGSGNDYANAMLLQPDGKVLIGGTSNNGSDNDLCLLRLNEDGTLDPTFGSSGIVITEVSVGNDEVVSMVLQPDGMLLVAGSAETGSNRDIALTRYHTGINTSVAQVEGNIGISVFPNPMTNELHINADTPLERVELFDVMGRSVISTAVNSSHPTMNVSDLPEGVYLLQVSSKEGVRNRTVIKK